MLTIRNLSIKYDDMVVLHDVSLSVSVGEIVCVCGESGCGKTSLLNAVMGFADSEGEIIVDGMQMNGQTIGQIRRRIAYVPQELALPHETVREMVRMPFMLKANRHVAFSEQTLLEDWKLLNLSPTLLEKKVVEISGGQRQRIMLSVAGLLGKPLMLVDEPTSALDVDSALMVLDYFKMLAESRGMAILAVSHHKEFADGCTRQMEI